MIDVRLVIAHSLWILGAAAALAAFSYYHWLAGDRQTPLRQILRVARGWKVSIAGGVLLVASGFLLMDGTRWWERGLWLLVWVGAAFDVWRLRSATPDTTSVRLGRQQARAKVEHVSRPQEPRVSS